MKKIKLCLIAPVPPPYGGIGNWVLLIREYIKNREDVDLRIISTAPVGRGIDGRTLWDRVVTQGLLMLKKRKELKKMIKAERPDCVHITTSGQLAIIRDIFLLKTTKKFKVPSAYHIRFGRVGDIAESDTREWKLISKAMNLADIVITIDKRTFETVRKYLPDVNVINIPNPIDASKLPEPRAEKERIVMFLGWLVKTKGVEELLTAWKSVKVKYPDWKLHLVGPSKPEYLEYLKGNFSFEGVEYYGEKSHDEAINLMNDAAIFVLPSHTEAFPNVILEAMAMKKPIIATSVGAIPEILEGDCGIIIEPFDSNAVAESLETLINDQEMRQRMAFKANEKLHREYALDTVFEKYVNEWNKLKENGG